MPRAKSTKPQYDAEAHQWLDHKHEACKLVLELLKTYFATVLGIGDARPVLRSPGKPAKWKAKLVTVPPPLRTLTSEGLTNRVLVIDRAWWEKAPHMERKVILHSLLAQAAKEKPIEVYATVIAAHGPHTDELRRIVEVGAKQLVLDIDVARSEFAGKANPEAPAETPAEATGANGPTRKKREPRKAAVASAKAAAEAPPPAA